MAETLGKMGHDVHLLAFNEGENVELDHVTIHRTPALPFLRAVKPGFSLKKICCDALMAVKSFWLERKHHYDVVHAVEESVFIAMLLCFFF